jgi:hypothetical protein
MKVLLVSVGPGLFGFNVEVVSVGVAGVWLEVDIMMAILQS